MAIDDNAEPAEPPAPSQLQRKKPKQTKTVEAKINDRYKQLSVALGGSMLLAKVIVFDEVEYLWWKCTVCEAKRTETYKLSKTMKTRDMVTHCKSSCHGKCLTGVLKTRNEERIKKLKQEEAKQKELPTNSYKTLPRGIANAGDSRNLFVFDMADEWHATVHQALLSLGLFADQLTFDAMRAVNYFHDIHDGIMTQSSLRQIEKTLKRQKMHGTLVPHHYIDKVNIQDAIKALAAAQQKMDLILIHKQKEVAVAEDGNKLHGLPGRGYMVSVIDNFELKDLFMALESPEKGDECKCEDLDSIDTGKDAYEAMNGFVTEFLRKDVEDAVTVVTDWSGTNGGRDKGSAARWKKKSPHSRWNWDSQHKMSAWSKRLSQLEEFTQMRLLLNELRNAIWNSSIVMQKYKRFLRCV